MKYTILLLLFFAWFFRPETPSKPILESCQEGDTIKVCIKSLYWRNGLGIPYSWEVPQPPGTAPGAPMEINFWENCDNPGGTGGGIQHVFFINLFEGETYQTEIVVGWGIEWGLVWYPPSTVQGEPAPLGNGARIAIFDENCENQIWPPLPLSLFPVAQQDPTCPSCPEDPPPDTSNYMTTPGFHQACKLVLCPI